MNSVTNSLKLSLQRTATYIDRLPLFTRAVLVAMVTLEVLRVLFPRSWWDLEEWGRLEPDVIGIATSMLLFSPLCFWEMGEAGVDKKTGEVLCGLGLEKMEWKQGGQFIFTNLATVYRTNTYPLIHTGIIHLILNLVSVTPLLERFEASHGTLTSLALFVGRESCPPILCCKETTE